MHAKHGKEVAGERGPAAKDTMHQLDAHQAKFEGVDSHEKGNRVTSTYGTMKAPALSKEYNESKTVNEKEED